MAEARAPARPAPPLDAALDTLPCGFFSLEDGGTVAAVNSTLATMLGYDRGEIVGRHVESLFTVAGRIFFQTHIYPLVRLKGKAEELFLLMCRKDGGEVGVLLNAARRERGGQALIDCVAMEVRERRKYEEALLRARQAAEAANAELAERTRALEAANQAKSQFLAVMSHELRTPLNAIGGYAQLLELGVHGPITDQQRVALERIQRAQRHLLRLINNVFNLARIEAGRVEYTMEDVEIDELVRNVLPMVEPQMATGGLRSVTAVPAGLRVRADREKVQQILINLLTNAVKFTPAGGTITVTAEAAGDDRVLINVIDTGIGIPADKLASVFEPFIQVDASHTRRTEGSGLGLAISRDLARGMGGDLTARSEEGKGSTFVLTLPRAKS